MMHKIKTAWCFLFAYFSTRTHSFKSREQLEQWQLKKLKHQLVWLQKNSPYLNAKVPIQKASELSAFPTMNKLIMMENIDQLNTAGLACSPLLEHAIQSEQDRNFLNDIDHNYSVGLSSGTSGNRGMFIASQQEQAIWAGTILAKVLPKNGIFNKQNIALFLRANSSLYEQAGKGLLKFKFFDMLLRIEQLVTELRDFNPSILVAPPSVIKMLLLEATKQGITLIPHKVISVAEVLHPDDKVLLSNYFQQPIHQVYQATEGFLATTCTHNTLHFNEDFIHLEKRYLHGSNTRFTPIITDLHRRTQPIVRYCLDDILVESKTPCPCGSPFLAIESIEGRMDSILYFPHSSNQSLVHIFPDFITRAILYASPEINEFRIVQHQPEKLDIQLDLNASAETKNIELEILKKITELCRTISATPPMLEFSNYQMCDPLSKRLRVKRTFTPDFQ